MVGRVEEECVEENRRLLRASSTVDVERGRVEKASGVWGGGGRTQGGGRIRGKR